MKHCKTAFALLRGCGILVLVMEAQTLPRPSDDHVGFPAGYQYSFTKLLTVDPAGQWPDPG